MVKTTVHLCKNCGGCLFYYIYLYQKLPCFAHQKFPWFKNQCQFFAIFFTEFIETFAQFFPKFLNICFNISFFIGHFKTASKVDKFKVVEIFGRIKEYFRSIEKNINIENEI